MLLVQWVARATIDRYYYDKVSSFDRDVLSKLCDFLQVKPGDLLVVVEQGKLFDSWQANNEVSNT